MSELGHRQQGGHGGSPPQPIDTKRESQRIKPKSSDLAPTDTIEVVVPGQPPPPPHHKKTTVVIKQVPQQQQAPKSALKSTHGQSQGHSQPDTVEAKYSQVKKGRWQVIMTWVVMGIILALCIATIVLASTNKRGLNLGSEFALSACILSIIQLFTLLFVMIRFAFPCMKCNYIFTLLLLLFYFIIVIACLVTHFVSKDGMNVAVLIMMCTLFGIYLVLPFLLRCLALQIKENGNIKQPWQFVKYWFKGSEENAVQAAKGKQ